MATSTQVLPTARTRTPFALWHLLSLDAPTVAALWVWFIARSAHIHLPLAATLAMALAVWMLYAADRLLDTRNLDHSPPTSIADFEARHFFHHRHRRLFLFAIAATAAALAAILHLLDAPAIRLYLIESALLFAWFVILHATRSAHRLPKEIAVGIFFSAAVFIPTIARDPTLQPSLAPAALLFAATCSLNCLFLYAWEHDPALPSEPSAQSPHPTTRLALAHLPTLTVALAVAAAAAASVPPMPIRAIAAACLLSALSFLTLHRNRHHLSRIHLRAAADLALLTPLLLLPFLR